jgi:hypothetical protein
MFELRPTSPFGRGCRIQGPDPMPQDHWLPGFNFNVEEWDAKGQTYETLAICRTLEPGDCPAIAQ